MRAFNYFCEARCALVNICMASCISAQKIDRNQNINHITLAFSIDFTFCLSLAWIFGTVGEKKSDWSNGVVKCKYTRDSNWLSADQSSRTDVCLEVKRDSLSSTSLGWKIIYRGIHKEFKMSRKCPTCEKTVYMGKAKYLKNVQVSFAIF